MRAPIFLTHVAKLYLMVNFEEKKIGIILEQANRITKLTFIKVFKKLGVDITPEQWVILDTLYKEDALSQTELGEKAYKNKPTISRIIDLTSRKKFTKRKPCAHDRRKFRIHLTAKGKKVVEKCMPEISKLRDHSWKGLTNKDYAEFQRITMQLFDNFNEYK